MTRTAATIAATLASSQAIAHAGHGAMTYHDHTNAGPLFLLALWAVLALAAIVQRVQRKCR